MPRPEPGYTAPVTAEPSPVDRRRLALLLVPFFVSAVVSTVGVALAPALLVKTPLLLVGLSPLWRHLLLASPSVDTLPFFAVGLPRMFAVDPFMYVLGRDFGDVAIEALVARLGAEKMIRRLDRAARRASWLLVLLWPDPLVCTLAGASRLNPVAFVILNLLGTVGALALARVSGEALAGPVGWLRTFLENNTLATTTISVAVVLLVTGLRVVARRLRGAPADDESDAPKASDDAKASDPQG